MSEQITPQTKRRLWKEECKNKLGIGDEEERLSAGTNPTALPSLARSSLMQPALSSLASCPRQQCLSHSRLIAWTGYSRHAMGTLSLPARSRSHLPLNPLGLAGAAQSSQQMRTTIRAKGFLICPQLAAKHRAAHLCLLLYEHPPPKLTELQPAARTKPAPSLPAHTQGNPCSGSDLCYRHQSVR